MVTISTRLGKVRGTQRARVHLFLGLRYGEPPRRFLSPVASGSWRGTFDATSYPNRALQHKTEGTLGAPILGEMSEDCLFLNIATPDNTGRLRPVLFWIHGGGFINGSGNELDGTVLAEQGDVVVVAVNYRLGSFGLLDLSSHGPEYKGSSSNSIRDLVLAMQWVRDNIEDYGGDPENVTISGVSSGGTFVLSLLATPAADELYHKAIAHSATCAYKTADDPTHDLCKQLKVSKDEFLNHLLALPAQEILALKLGFRVSVDHTVVTRPTFEAIKDRGSRGVPLLTGTNLREGSLYTQGLDQEQDHYSEWNRGLAKEMLCGKDPQKYLSALRETYPDASAGRFHEMIWTDMFRRTTSRAAELSSAAGPGGWLYRFDLAPTLPDHRHLGATHGSENAFVFNIFENARTHGFTYHDRDDPVVRGIARAWSETIVRFMRTGQPDDGEKWPMYESRERANLTIDNALRVESDPDALHRELWDA
jgi:para-nitrobenzyl esterase